MLLCAFRQEREKPCWPRCDATQKSPRTMLKAARPSSAESGSRKTEPKSAIFPPASNGIAQLQHYLEIEDPIAIYSCVSLSFSGFICSRWLRVNFFSHLLGFPIPFDLALMSTCPHAIHVQARHKQIFALCEGERVVAPQSSMKACKRRASKVQNFCGANFFFFSGLIAFNLLGQALRRVFFISRRRDRFHPTERAVRIC